MTGLSLQLQHHRLTTVSLSNQHGTAVTKSERKLLSDESKIEVFCEFYVGNEKFKN